MPPPSRHQSDQMLSLIEACNFRARSNVKKNVAVIGGGITGLSAAYFLQEKAKERGIEIHCTLIEADRRWGGKIVTDRVSDFIIEGGPDSFLSQKPWGLALCRKLGLIDQIVQSNPVHKTIYILSGGRLKKFPEGMNLMIPGRMTPFLLTSLISWRGKARMGLDLLIPKNNKKEDESIAAFVRRRLGNEAVTTFAEPILATIYAGDVEKLSMQATFPQLTRLEREFRSLIFGVWMRQRGMANASAWPSASRTSTAGDRGPTIPMTLFVTLRNGLEDLVSALERQMDGTVCRLGQRVNGLYPQERGYAIHLPNETIHADAVIVTTGATDAARFIRPWNKTLAGRLDGIPYVSTATVSLGFRRTDVAHPLDGFGFVTTRAEKKSVLATTWSSTKFEGRADPGHVLIRSFLGGTHQEEIVDLPDDILIAKACDDLTPLLGIRAKPILTRIFRWNKANPQYNIGHLDRVTAIEQETEKHAGLFLAGAAYRGVGIPDCIEQAWTTSEKVIQFISMASANHQSD